jgi:collagenase-like PrtC family protease
VRQKHGKTLSSCGIPARLSTTEIVAVAQLTAATAADLLLPRMAADGEVEIKYAIYGLPVTRATMHFITNAKANRFWERKTNRRAVAARATNLSRRPKTTENRIENKALIFYGFSTAVSISPF